MKIKKLILSSSMIMVLLLTNTFADTGQTVTVFSRLLTCAVDFSDRKITYQEKLALKEMLREEAIVQCQSDGAQLTGSAIYSVNVGWGGSDCPFYKTISAETGFYCALEGNTKLNILDKNADSDFCSGGCESICEIDPWFCSACRRICKGENK